MTTNLSTDQIGIISASVIGGVICLGAGVSYLSYLYKHSNDPICKNDDNAPIKVTDNYSDEARGLSRRKKSHTKSKKSRKIRSKK